MKYVAFDLEIAKEVPDGENMMDNLPLGITCAATITETGRVRVWHDSYAPQMSQEYAESLVEYLLVQERDHGRFPVTWNGLGFDFRVLAAESDMPGNCSYLAINHLDIPFQLLCEKGFMTGIVAAAEGMNLAGKTEGMHGAKAPAMWKMGREAQDKVLEYVEQDARLTAQLYEGVIENRCLRWVAKSGRLAKWYPTMVEGRLLTAGEAIEIPLPDTSWMDKPWDRNKFYGWVNETT